jgi:hypothetical protein
MYVKIIEAQQARSCNSYKNTKLKLLKTNAAIWFDQMCKIKHLKQNYINIKINGNKPLITHGCILTDYFNNCNFSKIE